MTICFIGNKFKYEIEAVMKLFLPLEKFNFIFLHSNAEFMSARGEICIISREKCPDDTEYRLQVCVELDGKARTKYR